MTARLLLAVLILVQSPCAPSQTAPSFEVGSQTASPAIEPTWIYITPLNWKRAPRGFHVSSSSATIAILYPEGQYFEAATILIKTDKGVSLMEGARVLSTGTWSRTDDKAIRIQSRVVFRNPPSESHKLPEPPNTDTCGLEGQSPTHLAQRIHCKAMILSPSHLNLDLTGLQRMATDAFEASPKPQTATAPLQ